MENNICTSWYSNVAIENEKKQTSHLKYIEKSINDVLIHTIL